MAGLVDRMTHAEARLDGHGRALSEIRDRELPDIRQSIVRLEEKMDRRFESVEASIRLLSVEMHTQFRWTLAGIGAAALTVIVAMFTKELLGR